MLFIEKIYSKAYSRVDQLNRLTNFKEHLPITPNTARAKISHYNQAIYQLHKGTNEVIDLPHNIVSEKMCSEYHKYLMFYPYSINSNELSKEFVGLVNGAIFYNITTNTPPSKIDLIPSIIDKLNTVISIIKTKPASDYASMVINLAAQSQNAMLDILKQAFCNEKSHLFLNSAFTHPKIPNKILNIETNAETVNLYFPDARVEYRNYTDLIFKSAVAKEDKYGKLALRESVAYEKANPGFVPGIFAHFHLSYEANRLYTSWVVRHNH